MPGHIKQKLSAVTVFIWLYCQPLVIFGRNHCINLSYKFVCNSLCGLGMRPLTSFISSSVIFFDLGCFAITYLLHSHRNSVGITHIWRVLCPQFNHCHTSHLSLMKCWGMLIKACLLDRFVCNWATEILLRLQRFDYSGKMSAIMYMVESGHICGRFQKIHLEMELVDLWQLL